MSPVVARSILLLTALLSATPWPLAAQELTTDGAVIEAPSTRATTAVDSGPVAVPEPSDQAKRFYRSGNLLWIVETLWGFAVPALLLFSGFSARMRTWASRLLRSSWGTIGIYVFFLTVVSTLLDLPLNFYSTYLRPHEYGLSNQTLAKWWGDAAKGLVIGLVFSTIAVGLLYLLLRMSPRRWWLWTSLASVPLITLLLLVSPAWLDPLFNKFGPLSDPTLETQILELADRAGIEGSDVFEVEMSVDTETLNAYVAGLGATKRIVLWDTMLARLEPREILVVMGHEMGHYVLHHVPYQIMLLSSLILVGLWVIHRTASGLIKRFGSRFGFTQISDVASLPLILLLFGLVSFVLTPAIFAFGRSIEHEADRFGLEITRDNHAAATAFVKLQEQNLSNPRPGPLYKLFRSTHPPLGERIDFANRYRPWEKGEPLKYGGLIRGTP